mmetsp:Transcript_40929/g.101035  ORF Transcript_40929/g.101035 Transcript_40929/m.101035 type:complete len:234 (-) Transcript_40929:554-1255(-)
MERPCSRSYSSAHLMRTMYRSAFASFHSSVIVSMSTAPRGPTCLSTYTKKLLHPSVMRSSTRRMARGLCRKRIRENWSATSRTPRLCTIAPWLASYRRTETALGGAEVARPGAGAETVEMLASLAEMLFHAGSLRTLSSRLALSSSKEPKPMLRSALDFSASQLLCIECPPAASTSMSEGSMQITRASRSTMRALSTPGITSLCTPMHKRYAPLVSCTGRSARRFWKVSPDRL